MDILLMGTASATAGAERDNTYLLIRPQSHWIMIDVGGNPLGKLKKLGIATDEIKEIVFTHFHIDHIYGLPSLLWGMWLDGRKEPLTIYCSEDNELRLRSWLEVMGVKEWPIQFAIQVRTFPWKKETQLIGGEGFSMMTFPSLHLGSTVGLKMMDQDEVIVYSADTMLNPRIKEEPRIDLLIHEATTAFEDLPNHTSLKQLTEFYELDRVGEVIAVHLTDGEPYEEVTQSLNPHIREKVKIGYDLMKIK
ncbi:MBL fold metallo-hydrolase [Ammoniphilus sp. CFH 90114]|uniref:MBL fold metallo-hydrolase n=1 Tax=Ammoniphilus sp. CFH 90114 TaxID=2493665 RepID=UPI00100D9F81|nr:ribonuclease Z [Ammoniphilus sp. CFH 90114]RXT15433.1 ribonuclease Z [Ammoniphilus sp. CFH 90114]